MVAAATRLAVSGAILGSAALSSVATLGANLVIGYLVDQLLDYLLKKAGFDPEEELTHQMEQVLDNLRDRLIDGDPDDIAAFEQDIASYQRLTDKDERQELQAKLWQACWMACSAFVKPWPAATSFGPKCTNALRKIVLGEQPSRR